MRCHSRRCRPLRAHWPSSTVGPITADRPVRQSGGESSWRLLGLACLGGLSMHAPVSDRGGPRSVARADCARSAARVALRCTSPRRGVMASRPLPGRAGWTTANSARQSKVSARIGAACWGNAEDARHALLAAQRIARDARNWPTFDTPPHSSSRVRRRCSSSRVALVRPDLLAWHGKRDCDSA